MDNASPFDLIADQYDATFSDTQLGRWLRQATWDYLLKIFQSGEHVLDLGCGTGEDAIMLARRGVYVTALDASPQMLATAREKAAAADLSRWIDSHTLDLEKVKDGEEYPFQDGLEERRFDGAYANFGVLNCLPDLKPLARMLGSWIRPGGRLVIVLMGPFCAWETLWYLAHLQPSQAFRRWKRGQPARLGAGAEIRVWYPSPGNLASVFSLDFQISEIGGIGVFLPPSYLSNIVDQHPSFFSLLERAERKLHQIPPFPQISDHYLLGMERRGRVNA